MCVTCGMYITYCHVHVVCVRVRHLCVCVVCVCVSVCVCVFREERGMLAVLQCSFSASYIDNISL